MAEMVRIQKSTVTTLVHLEAFNNIYKPAGWEIVEESVVNELDHELASKGIIDEKQQNAYIRAKHERSKRKFNDGLFKGE